jgi:hypothetical protein
MGEEINTRLKTVFSDCGRYRPILSRTGTKDSLATGDRRFTWVMLNPSKADATTNDPTINRVVNFTARFGGAHLHVINLFDYCATKPRDLTMAKRPLQSPHWHLNITIAITDCDELIFAWGSPKYPLIRYRFEDARLMIEKTAAIARKTPMCLRINMDGNPAHPLYQSSKTTLIPYTKP